MTDPCNRPETPPAYTTSNSPSILSSAGGTPRMIASSNEELDRNCPFHRSSVTQMRLSHFSQSARYPSEVTVSGYLFLNEARSGIASCFKSLGTLTDITHN